MRCKLSSHQDEIVAMYKELERITTEKPDLLKIVRVKNRL